MSTSYVLSVYQLISSPPQLHSPEETREAQRLGALPELTRLASGEVRADSVPCELSGKQP